MGIGAGMETHGPLAEGPTCWTTLSLPWRVFQNLPLLDIMGEDLEEGDLGEVASQQHPPILVPPPHLQIPPRDPLHPFLLTTLPSTLQHLTPVTKASPHLRRLRLRILTASGGQGSTKSGTASGGESTGGEYRIGTEARGKVGAIRGNRL